MPKYRSATTTQGKNMAGARALWRATGMTNEDFNKPIIAIVNSFTEFVPGHIHLQKFSKIIKQQITLEGGVAKEFNTIAIDDGIAMGHSGMLYSLPSRELIADSVEYMINAHCVDAMVCVSNCDKITPGMLMACLRLNIPTVFISGGPMEAGRLLLSNNTFKKINLVDAIVHSGNPDSNHIDNINEVEKLACPTCGSCSGMFTANSMNCLTEALGLALPGNGTLLATHIDRKKLVIQASKTIVKITKSFYENNDNRVLPRNIVNMNSLMNAMTLDIAMGGSSNTILHLLAIAQEGQINFKMSNINTLSKKVPCICKIAPSDPFYHMEDLHRAGGVIGILNELNDMQLLDNTVRNILETSLQSVLNQYNILKTNDDNILNMFKAGPMGIATKEPFSQSFRWSSLDNNRQTGCIRSEKFAFSKEGGIAILYGNLAPNGCVVKTAGVSESNFIFEGPAKTFDSQESAMSAILNFKIQKGDVVVIRYEGPKGGPGMQEMLYPTSYLKSMNLDQDCALITDGRFSGGTSGLSIGHISPEAANKGLIALIQDNDLIKINIPNRSIHLDVSHSELKMRRQYEENKKKQAYLPVQRTRKVSKALQAYALLATSADQGAIRKIDCE